MFLRLFSLKGEWFWGKKNRSSDYSNDPVLTN